MKGDNQAGTLPEKSKARSVPDMPASIVTIPAKRDNEKPLTALGLGRYVAGGYAGPATGTGQGTACEN